MLVCRVFSKVLPKAKRPTVVRLHSNKANIAKYLTLLEIKEENLTREVLRRQYIAMVKKYHPDAATDEGSLDKFLQVDEVIKFIVQSVLRSLISCHSELDWMAVEELGL